MTNYVQTIFRYPPQVGFWASWRLGDDFHESSDLECSFEHPTNSLGPKLNMVPNNSNV